MPDTTDHRIFSLDTIELVVDAETRAAFDRFRGQYQPPISDHNALAAIVRDWLISHQYMPPLD